MNRNISYNDLFHIIYDQGLASVYLSPVEKASLKYHSKKIQEAKTFKRKCQLQAAAIKAAYDVDYEEEFV